MDRTANAPIASNVARASIARSRASIDRSYRNLTVYSTNTESTKTIGQLNEDDWQLYTPDVVNKKGYTNDQAVREINQAVVDGLATWDGRSATLEDAQKIAAPVYASFEKWSDHGAYDTEPRAEFTGILLSIGFSEDTICR